MADVTHPGVAGERAPVPGAGARATPEPAPPGARAVDPRAVRVRLAPASRVGDEPALLVAPAPAALRMTNPTTGTGPFGGITEAAPGAADPDPPEAVLAQRRAVLVDGEPLDLALVPGGRDRYVLLEGGARHRVVVGPRQGAGAREVLVDGFRFEVEVEPERIAALRERASRGRVASAHGGPLEVRAIIPGRVVSVSVGPGDPVTAGQQLLVVEAMKMQNELRSPRDGTIERIAVATGATIEVGDLLMVID